MQKRIVFAISLTIIALWWIFQALWTPGVVHVLAQNGSPAIERALLYATRGSAQVSDIYFTAAEVSHLSDVAVLYQIISALLNILAIFSWGILSFAVYRRYDLRPSLKLASKMLFVLMIVVVSSLLFFPVFFERFHAVLFPMGNWAFPETSMLITLFPELFWKWVLALILGLLGVCSTLFWIL